MQSTERSEVRVTVKRHAPRFNIRLSHRADHPQDDAQNPVFSISSAKKRSRTQQIVAPQTTMESPPKIAALGRSDDLVVGADGLDRPR
jgi:hypothetical protein